VLDPFFGTGTTGAGRAEAGRRWIGIERDKEYVKLARARIKPSSAGRGRSRDDARKEQRAAHSFGTLIERGMLQPGEILFDARRRWTAKVRPTAP